MTELKKTVADFIDGQYESKKEGDGCPEHLITPNPQHQHQHPNPSPKQEGMAATLAPISVMLDTYANGLRDHAVSA